MNSETGHAHRVMVLKLTNKVERESVHFVHCGFCLREFNCSITAAAVVTILQVDAKRFLDFLF